MNAGPRTTAQRVADDEADERRLLAEGDVVSGGSPIAGAEPLLVWVVGPQQIDNGIVPQSDQGAEG